MSASCCPPSAAAGGPAFRSALWIALAVNLAMFVAEIGASAWSGSSALAADAADFLSDAANYGLSIGAIALGGAWSTRAALAKGWAMGVYGLAVIAYTAWRAWLGVPPEPVTMGVVGSAALVANFGVAALLYRFRDGDANMRSAWLCTRNDVIGNLAVLLAAAGVFGTSSGWPDHAVAALLAILAISSSLSVIRHAVREQRGHLEMRAR